MNIKSIKIGNQVWMAQNVGARGSPLPDRIGKGVYPDGKEQNVREGGYLYQFHHWPPIPGWRVPKVEDWGELINFLGADAGKKLISGPFRAVCCGYTDPWLRGNSYQAFGRLAVFWIDEIKPKTEGVPYCIEINRDGTIDIKSGRSTQSGFSVRCIQEKSKEE